MEGIAMVDCKDTDEELCGEIYFTTKGSLIFICTLCEERCKEFPSYVEHIWVNHNVVIEKTHTKQQIYNLDPLGHSDDSSTSFEHADPELETSKKILRLDEAVEDHIANENIESTAQSQSTIDFVHVLESVDRQIKKKRYKIEIRKFKCPQCDYSARDNTNLAAHIRRHSAHKPYACTQCEKAFYTKSELNTHSRTHTGERPFLCTDCGRAFMTSGMLSDHAKRHKNLREKECTVCKMKFYSAKQLRAHIVIHSNIRLHKCTLCDKAFKQRVALNTHMKLHANKKEYQCELCSSSFNQGSGLYSHMKNKHKNLSPITNDSNCNSSHTQHNRPSIPKIHYLKSKRNLEECTK